MRRPLLVQMLTLAAALAVTGCSSPPAGQKLSVKTKVVKREAELFD